MKKLIALLIAALICVPCFAETDLFAGRWQDPYYGRALLEISHTGNRYDIRIHWGNSADSESVWEMDATRDGDSLVYSNGRMTVLSYDESGACIAEDVMYDDAEGTFTLTDGGKLSWADSREERAPEFALERVPAQDMAAPPVGGWAPSDDPTVTEALRAIFDAGTEALTGVGYVPVAYMGSQVVAGVNYAFLCQAVSAYPGVEGMEVAPSYAMVYLYKDLSGNVSILNIADFDIGAMCTYGAE